MDRVLTVVAAIAAPVCLILVSHGIIDPRDAQPIGAIVAALVAGYHLNNDKARRAIRAQTGVPRSITRRERANL